MATQISSAKETPTVEQQLEALSKEFYAFDMQGFVYRSTGMQIASEEVKRRNSTLIEENKKYKQQIENLLKIPVEKTSLILTLKHRDPKVRTLALALLFSLDDVSVLPEIAALLDDKENTFLGPGEYGPPGIAREFLLVTVSEQATIILNFYLKPTIGHHNGGCHPTPVNRSQLLDFFRLKENWSISASGLAVRYIQIKRQSKPTSSIALQTLQKDVSKIPLPQRLWTLLWIYCRSYGPTLTSEQELLSLAKEAGPDAILDLIINSHVPSNDPSFIRYDENTNTIQSLVNYSLKNFAPLLRSQDVDPLLNYYRQTRECDPLYAIVAARLQPARAFEILTSSSEISPTDTGKFHAALWEIKGESQKEYLINWFYDSSLKNIPTKDVPVLSGTSNQYSITTSDLSWQSDFIQTILQTERPSPKSFIMALLQDNRLEKIELNRVVIRELAKSVNDWSSQTIISKNDLLDLGRGYGKLSSSFGAPREDLPEFKKELIRKIRDSVPLWGSSTTSN